MAAARERRQAALRAAAQQRLAQQPVPFLLNSDFSVAAGLRRSYAWPEATRYSGSGKKSRDERRQDRWGSQRRRLARQQPPSIVTDAEGDEATDGPVMTRRPDLANDLPASRSNLTGELRTRGDAEVGRRLSELRQLMQYTYADEEEPRDRISDGAHLPSHALRLRLMMGTYR